MIFDFDVAFDEQDITINIDPFMKEVDLFTSNSTVANRIYQRMGKPTKYDKFGAKWVFTLKDITKLAMGIFKVGRY